MVEWPARAAASRRAGGDEAMPVMGRVVLCMLVAAWSAGPAGAQGARMTPTAVIVLEKGGEIELELYPADAPKTVESFVTLAKKGFYNGLTFHRVEPGFVAQGGDPKGDGTGGPGYTLKAEFNQRLHVRGTLAMARAQHPDSAGSQFYICFAPAPFLDGKYTVFGQVVKGMEVVDGIRRGDRMKTIRIAEPPK
jgi:cyclophilin family peptidyl-prolyl cis-trans isomerase